MWRLNKTYVASRRKIVTNTTYANFRAMSPIKPGYGLFGMTTLGVLSKLLTYVTNYELVLMNVYLV